MRSASARPTATAKQRKVKNVVGNGGTGNDSVRVVGKTEQVGGAAITFNLIGGGGDDHLEGNFGDDIYQGWGGI